MSVTLNIKADVAGTLVWEDRRFRELSETSNRTTGTFYDETSDTSLIQYTGNDGQQGFLDKVYATLQASKNPLIASDWNTFQSESKTSFDALETATYSNVSATGLRDLVLSGNKNGALTQTVSGESAVNLFGDFGGFYKDSDSDGVADGWAGANTTSETLLNQIQSFTAIAQFAIMARTFPTAPTGLDKIYFAIEVETDSSSVNAFINDGVGQSDVSHSGGSNFERLSVIRTLVPSPSSLLIGVQDLRGGAWTEIRIKKSIAINLTNEGDAGLSLAQADLKYAKYFDNIGHATINQKMSGTNGEFELKEPYVLPKTKDGTTTTTVEKDKQNFLRPAHKQEILNGGLNWTGFTTSGSVIYAYVDNLSEEEFLSLTLNSGDFVNNDFNFRMSTSISTTENSATYNVANSRLTLGILQSLAGATQATFEAYINNNPVKSSIALALAEYNTGLLDIPIKHLGSIEGGTYTNNLTILPSAITLTYPTNEAAERESSQVAQNQLETVSKRIKEETNTTYQNGLPIYEQPIFSQTQTTVYVDGLPVLEFDNTTATTTEYIDGLPTKEITTEV